MNKVSFFAITGAAGTIASYLANANEFLRSLAAIASIIASCSAILLARANLKKTRHDQAERENRSNRGNEILTLLLPMLSLISLIPLAACSTSDKSPLARLAKFPAAILDKAATLVTTTTTNLIEQAVVTTTDAVMQDPLTFILSTNTTLTTNYALVTTITATTKPALTKATEIGETAATFLPPPYGEIAAGIFGLASVGLTAAVRRRNAMLKTVIRGVEKEGNKDVKMQIDAEAHAAGVAEELHSLVNNITR